MVLENKKVIAIEGPEYQLGWTLLMAFRYAVNRHFTQALLDIQQVIVGNFDLLCDDFIRQMIEDIDFERRAHGMRYDKEDISYLDWFYNQCVEEYTKRKS